MTWHTSRDTPPPVHLGCCLLEIRCCTYEIMWTLKMMWCFGLCVLVGISQFLGVIACGRITSLDKVGKVIL